MSVPMDSTAAAIPVPCDVLMATILVIPKRLNVLKKMTGHGIKIWVPVSPARISLALPTTKLKSIAKSTQVRNLKSDEIIF